MPKPLLEKLQKVYNIDGKFYIHKSQSHHIEFINLNSLDQVYGSLFHLMVKAAFRDHRNFIVAKVRCKPTFKDVEEEEPTEEDWL